MGKKNEAWNAYLVERRRNRNVGDVAPKEFLKELIATPAPRVVEPTTYEVRSGDNYFNIAQRLYGNQMMAGNLIAENDGRRLTPGMTLRAPVQVSNPIITHAQMAYMRGETPEQYASSYRGAAGQSIPSMATSTTARPGVPTVKPLEVYDPQRVGQGPAVILGSEYAGIPDWARPKTERSFGVYSPQRVGQGPSLMFDGNPSQRGKTSTVADVINRKEQSQGYLDAQPRPQFRDIIEYYNYALGQLANRLRGQSIPGYATFGGAGQATPDMFAQSPRQDPMLVNQPIPGFSLFGGAGQATPDMFSNDGKTIVDELKSTFGKASREVASATQPNAEERMAAKLEAKRAELLAEEEKTTAEQNILNTSYSQTAPKQDYTNYLDAINESRQFLQGIKQFTELGYGSPSRLTNNAAQQLETLGIVDANTLYMLGYTQNANGDWVLQQQLREEQAGASAMQDAYDGNLSLGSIRAKGKNYLEADLYRYYRSAANRGGGSSRTGRSSYGGGGGGGGSLYPSRASAGLINWRISA
jgi:hypothetical protein